MKANKTHGRKWIQQIIKNPSCYINGYFACPDANTKSGKTITHNAWNMK